MNVCKHLQALLLVAMALAIPTTAAADITGFQFNSITAVGSECSLEDRLGLTVGSSSHVINIEDCTSYLTDACTIQVMWSLTSTPASGATWMVKMSKPGGSCNDTDFTTLGGTCLETAIVDEKDLSTSTNVTFTVPVSQVVGGNCSAGTDSSTKIYILLKETTVVSGQQISAHAIPIQVDLKAPLPPTLGEATEGDSNITVKWKDDQNSDTTDLKYKVYWSDTKFEAGTSKGSLKSSDAVTGASYQVTGLTNDTTYYFAVTTVDPSGNESAFSAISAGMPIQVRDFYEMYKEAGGRDKGTWCFVATAAYGSPMQPEVQALRDFRDRYLLTWGVGRVLVEAYYAASPPLADFIARHEAVRAVARAALWPAVWAARAADALPSGWGWLVPAGLLILAGGAGFATVRAVRGGRRAP